MNTVKAVQAKKGFHGWNCEQIEEVNGNQYKISTMKRYSGKISSHARKVTVSDGLNAVVISYSPLEDKSIDLYSGTGAATKKAIEQAHILGLLEFDRLKDSNLLPEQEKPYEIKEGQIFDEYNMHSDTDGSQSVCFAIRKTNFGTYYECINLTTKKIRSLDYVKPWSKKFGIGTYYTEGNFYPDMGEISNLVIEAKAAEAVKAQKDDAAQLMTAQIRAGKIEEGKKLVTIPTWAKSVIVADEYKNESDSMTDYFNTIVIDTVYLAYSKTTRNNMSELKNASKLFKETADYVERAAENMSLESPKYDGISEIIDGGGTYVPRYFLGSSNWYGWKVNKRKYFDLTNERIREKLYIAAAEGKYLCEEPKTVNQEAKVNTKAENVEIFDYSEKAFAVIGNTKPIKDDLKKLGGKFNFRLKCGAGWIFSKKQLQDVKTFLNID